MQVDTKKIGLFLKSLEGADYIYLQHVIGIRSGIMELIKSNNLTKESVCSRFNIKPNQYNNFTKGNYNYSISDISRLNASFMELEMEKLKDKVPVKIANA